MKKVKQVTDDGVIYQTTRRLSDGKTETVALVAPWGKGRRKFLGILESGGVNPPAQEIIRPSAESYKKIADMKSNGALFYTQRKQGK